MLNKLVNHRLPCPISLLKRSATVPRDFNLANQMKQLNNKKQFKKALELFDEYKKTHPETPSDFIINQALKACTEIGDIHRGSRIHRHLSSKLKENSYVLTSLIHFYMQCGDVAAAQALFDTSSKKPVQMYGAMMKGYIKNDQAQKAIHLFHEIQNPDDIIILLLFNACAQLGTNDALILVKQVSSQIPKSFYSNSHLLTSLLDALMKCGDMEHAQALFDTSSKKTVQMYGAMMKGYITNDQPQKAIDLFNQIKEPDEVIIILLFNACAQLETNEALKSVKQVSSQIPKSFYSNDRLITSQLDALIKCGDLEQAQALFNASTKKLLSMYSAMMKGYIKNDQAQKAIHLFHEIKNPDDIIILLLFNACAQLGTNEALKLVKQVSSQIPKSFYSNSHLLTSLLDALIKCGDMEQAQALFNASTNKVLSVYGAMMKGYIENNQANRVIDLFNQVKEPNEIIMILLFNACAQLGTNDALKLVKEVSSQIPKSFYSNDRLVTSQLDALMKCGDLEQAEALFNASTKKPVQMYGAMMKGYIKNDQAQKAIHLFHEIQNPDDIIILLLFNACAQIGTNEALKLVKQVSSQIPKSFYSNDRFLTSQLDALMKCGDMEHAEALFNASTNKVLSMYSAMMKGYIQNDQAQKAIHLFHEIKNPDDIIILLLFNACAQLGTNDALILVKEVSSQIPKSFYSNSHLLTSQLDALMKCGDLEQAEALFNASTNKVLSVYGAMMKGYIQNDQAQKAIDLFNQITEPDEVIINLLFNACAQLGTNEALKLVKEVSSQIPKSFYSNDRLVTSQLDALMKCGDLEQAEALFNASTNKVLSVYGAMMKGYIQNDQAKKAIDLFNQMKEPNEVIIILLFNACAQLGTNEALKLVKEVSSQIPKSFYSNDRFLTSQLDALVKCGDMEQAQSLFDASTNKILPMYTVMMHGFNINKHPAKTINLLNQMKIDGIDPNFKIHTCVIQALSKIGDYSMSEAIIEQIPDSCLVERSIQNALIDMWGKTGYVDRAKEIFQKNSQPDQIGYTAMINSFGLNGMGTAAIELYRQMPSEFIAEAAHVCVLNACSHSGLVDEGRSIFNTIQTKTEKIYTTMVDCLSRASIFDEAQKLIKKFEHDHSPVAPMYMALLSGARNEKNSSLAALVFDRMKQLFPDLPKSLTSASVLLANVYGALGELEKASDIRYKLNKSGVKKQIGISSTVLNGRFYEFRAHDRSHPRSNEIYAEVEKLSKEIIQHGHQYDASWVTRPLDYDETVASVLCGHSEQLVIGFHFLENPTTKRIQLTKNLRICGDCHRATKLIAAVRQCEIIVRDANRIHHFYPNGKCSCNDYF